MNKRKRSLSPVEPMLLTISDIAVNDPRREAPGHGVRSMPVVVQPICRSHWAWH
jgi:hypothetical protein